MERWLLTYADLITLLLILFIMLYSMSNIKIQEFEAIAGALARAFNTSVFRGEDVVTVAGAGGGQTVNAEQQEAQQQQFQQVSQQIDDALRAQGLANKVSVLNSKDGIVISLQGNLLFFTGRADIRPEAFDVLDQVALLVRDLPNVLRVEGHTDDLPTNTVAYPTNWELSVARATAIARYLIDYGGIAPSRIQVVGYGPYRPIADNATAEGRAKNRRADIVIIYDDRVSAASAPQLKGGTAPATKK